MRREEVDDEDERERDADPERERELAEQLQPAAREREFGFATTIAPVGMPASFTTRATARYPLPTERLNVVPPTPARSVKETTVGFKTGTGPAKSEARGTAGTQKILSPIARCRLTTGTSPTRPVVRTAARAPPRRHSSSSSARVRV